MRGLGIGISMPTQITGAIQQGREAVQQGQDAVRQGQDAVQQAREAAAKAQALARQAQASAKSFQTFRPSSSSSASPAPVPAPKLDAVGFLKDNAYAIGAVAVIAVVAFLLTRKK